MCPDFVKLFDGPNGTYYWALSGSELAVGATTTGGPGVPAANEFVFNMDLNVLLGETELPRFVDEELTDAVRKCIG